MRTNIEDLFKTPDAEQKQFMDNHKTCGRPADLTVSFSVYDQAIQRTVTCEVCHDSDSYTIADPTHPKWNAIRAYAVELIEALTDLVAVQRAAAIRSRVRQQVEQERTLR